MYLIDNSYFYGKYEIANINESSSGIAQSLDEFIDIEVREFMQGFLGMELFMEFDSCVQNGTLKPDSPQKWLDLVNGVTYIEGDNTRKWNGLLYKIGGYPKSLLTNYIWCKYMVERNRIDGNGNSNVIDSKNATMGNPANQFFPIWNEFVNMVHYSGDYYTGLNQYMSHKTEDYQTANTVNVQYENRFL